MRSMKSPLGTLDSRVTMADSQVDGLLSPSFASVLGFDEPEEAPLEDLRSFEEREHYRLTTDSFESSESKTSSESCNSQDSGKRSHSRLELDVAMDEAHALDGPAEYANPQNSPDSNNDVHQDQGLDCKAEKMHTHAAPQGSSSPLDSLEDSVQPNHSTENKGTAPTTSHLSVSDQQQSALPTTPVRDDCRTVRFSPLESPQCQASDSMQRPLPRAERKPDYISLYRQQKQQKQHEKWRNTCRLIVPRSLSSRSPTKLNPSSLKRQPEIRFSSMSKVPFCKEASVATSIQGTDPASASEVDTANCQTPVRKADAPPGRVYDLVVLNIGIYRSRYPQSLIHGSRWGFWHIRMCPTFIPARSLTEEAQQIKQIICRLQAEDLLLHFVVVVPYFVAQIPLAALAKASRLANSRAGLSFLDIIRVSWSLAAAFINLALRRFWRMEFGYHGKIETE